MRKNLTMSMTIVIMIVAIGALIVAAISGFTEDTQAAEPATESAIEFFVESPETEVVTETQKAETSFVVKDGSVEMYHGEDLYWSWDNTEIGDDAKVIELNELSYRFAVQDGHKVWLIKDRETIELITENGLVFGHPYYEAGAEGVWIVEDGNLRYQMLYPLTDIDSTVECDVEVSEVVNRYVFKDTDGVYWAYKLAGSWRDIGDDDSIEIFRLGTGRVLDDDVQELHYTQDLERFMLKYNMHGFWD